MLSARAQKYLATLERRPALRDESSLEEAFTSLGLPILAPVISFQVDYGGYAQQYGLNRFVWGIIHSHPDPDSFLEPNQLNVEPDDDEPSNYFVTCANCHGSDHWFLNAHGALHWCFVPPITSSFDKKIEQDAVAWEIKSSALRRIVPTVSDAEFISLLKPKIEDGLIEEATDEYGTLYLHGGIYASIRGNRITAYLVADEGQTMLRGLPASIEPAKRTAPPN